MDKEIMARLHRTYNVLFSIVLVIAGICLIAGVLCIYFSGDHPFSRESVAATFSGIAFPVYLCIAMTIINILWEILSPVAEQKFKAKKITPKKTNETPTVEADEKKHRLIRNAILAASVIFIVAGLINGGTIAVLAKAINICTECIGLG